MKRFLLICSLCCLGLAGPARALGPTAQADSLLRLLNASRPDTSRVNLLIQLAWARTDDSPVTAIRYGQQGRQLAHQLRFSRGECRTLLMLGWAFLRSGNYPTAIQSMQAARRLAERINYRGGQVHADNGMGYAHLEQGSPRLALRYLFRAVRRAEAIGDKMLLTPIPGNIGQAYLQLNKTDSARHYIEWGYRLDLEQQDWHSEIGDLALLGDVAMQSGQPEQARAYYRRCIERAEGRPISYALCQAWLGLARLARQQNQPVQALANAQRALEASQQGGYTRGILIASEALANQYEARGDTARAFAHLRRASQTNGRLFSLNRLVQVQALDFGEQLRRQEQGDERRQQQAQQRQNLLLGSLLLLFISSGVGYLLISRQHLRREVALVQERQQLERRYAAEILQIEEKERRRVGADLHDGVGQLLCAAHMNLAALQQQLVPGEPQQQSLLATAVATIDESVREIRSISHGLAPVALLERGLVPAAQQLLGRLRYSAPGLAVELHTVGLPAPGLPGAAQALVYRILQEAVQNVLRHAHATELTVQLLGTATDLTVMVEDNGRGFANKTEGLGMHNIRLRARYLNADLQLDSEPGRGTTLTLRVPLETPAATPAA
ncbi:tetratricopeptide repeat-containing sensor histidine kinase [Hymenobacter aerophilus]|uniref:tetratricopeptide repeat-containing sensor histidine kinase n=1 Tax=Hymenobacter aerophilus TaxID=119644 RepID=UPI00037C6728|nr:sensor histidine kinase [Hymenobacter aerophilus]